MKPFKCSRSLGRMTDRYPGAETILEVVRDGGHADRCAIARQWLSEGIPFAFKECPAVYEAMRCWLSRKLGVMAKEISLTGSARLGSSLAPRTLGKPFGPGSDLDLFAVSESLFESMCDGFNRWALDYQNGNLPPRDERQNGNWKDNSDRGPGLVRRGFLDSWMIPTLRDYDKKQVGQAMWELAEKLKVTGNAPTVRKATLRCYNSWEACEQQMSRNLRSL